jgi:class 3 adenylate cyclase/tetratricopeptide (TPR) repeat protein
MLCAKCSYDNPADALFCMKCGTKVENVCSSCNTVNPADANFCRKCGGALGADAPVSAPSPHAALETPSVEISHERQMTESLDGERKTVTTLFADIKGSTELMEDLDPEEARRIIDPALKLMIDAVQRYDGYIVQSTGDGIFALFGAPVAHQDHPQRALYAGLRMQDALRRYSATLVAEGGIPIQCRVGANTGEVVVRTISTGEGHTEYTPIGHSTNLASRMQAVAPVGSIAVSDATRHWCEGYFAFRSLGPTRLKGVPAPIEVHEVTGLGPLRTRLQRAVGRGLTKFVGREREVEAMRHAAILAKEGRGQLVAVMAEPGVGKSRLFYEFKLRSQLGWLVLEAFSISHGKASPYLPVIELLHGYFGIDATDDGRKRREKVNGRIVTLDPALEDTRPYLFALLGLTEGDDPLAQIDAQIRRRRTLDAIKRILLRESLNQPLMLIFEDLHWIDEETQAFLNLLAEGMANAPVLLLVNYRMEYGHAWSSKTYYTQLRLDPLGEESAGEMLSALVGDSPELVSLKRLVLERTEGNPLFMEELVQALFDEGALVRNGTVKLTRPLSQLKIPPTVQGILSARIDRLPPGAKELLQTLAVIGTEFQLSLLRQVVQLPSDQLDRLLSGLQAGEFIYEQPTAGDVEYTFKHALTHDVAYSSLLTERRKLLHERTAQAIEELFADRLEDHLSQLAYHFDRSGNVPKAVEYLSRTAARAAQQVAHSEAIGYFTRALELLPRLPDGADRDSQELDLQMALSWSSFVVRGPRTPQRESALVRARELCERLGDNAKLMEALLGLAHLHVNRRDFDLARELAEGVLAMAQQAETPGMLAGAHTVLGILRFATGRFPAARKHFERAVELSASGPSRDYVAYFAQNAPNILIATLVILGYPSTPLSRAHELLAAARRSSDPNSIATALFSYGIHHVLLRDTRMVEERADELLSISTEHDLPVYYLIAAIFFRGWTMAAAERAEEGIAEMRRSISDPMIAEAAAPALLLVALAETCSRNGRAEDGLDLVAKGLATAEQTGIRVAEAELHSIKGDLLLATDLSNLAEAERCLRTAIDVSRRQGARLFELRATVSLARLLKGQGKAEEAREMLAKIYQLVHGGLRHRRPQRSESTTRRTHRVAEFAAGAPNSLAAAKVIGGPARVMFVQLPADFDFVRWSA